MDVSKAITDIRELKRISPAELADKIGIERPNYYRLEKRGEKLTIEQLKKIAQALDVDISDLLGFNKVVELGNEVNETKKEIKELKEKFDELNNVSQKQLESLIEKVKDKNETIALYKEIFAFLKENLFKNNEDAESAKKMLSSFGKK